MPAPNARPDVIDHSFRVVVGSLRFDRDRAHDLRNIPQGHWPALLALTDEARLTLPLGIRHSGALPEATHIRVDRNLAGNAERHAAVITAYRQIADALEQEKIPFVFLKGLSHYPHFCDDPRHRQQYDVDVYSPPANLERLRHALRAIGFESIDRGRETRTDHLPVMIRKTGWRWRGDYYDPEMPLHVEAHFRLWDPEMERFDVSGVRSLWERREIRADCGIAIPAFAFSDTVRYAAWHLVRHLLRGNLCPGHVYEFAHLLERTARDDAFWADWKSKGGSEMLAEALAAKLASECFGCNLNGVVAGLIDSLSARVMKWFELFAQSSLAGAVQHNKNELFLHLLLARSGKLGIAMRRLFPAPPSRFVRNPHVATADGRAGQLRFLARRAGHHLRALAPLTRDGFRWMRAMD